MCWINKASIGKRHLKAGDCFCANVATGACVLASTLSVIPAIEVVRARSEINSAIGTIGGRRFGERKKTKTGGGINLDGAAISAIDRRNAVEWKAEGSEACHRTHRPFHELPTCHEMLHNIPLQSLSLSSRWQSVLFLLKHNTIFYIIVNKKLIMFLDVEFCP